MRMPFVLRGLVGSALLVGVLVVVALDGIGGHGPGDWTRDATWWQDGHVVHALIRLLTISLMVVLAVWLVVVRGAGARP